ncbi:amidase [Palleronia sp. LCG004]|uniref:amidase n=1 Tax=Palleronia sp. LCG004 TaxID=3079304 RepID=UPI002943318D|nr:amidase [Palleronia sp. LCG004]WOI58016.1 amidase [Palleronia sp. LCG004]
MTLPPLDTVSVLRSRLDRGEVSAAELAAEARRRATGHSAVAAVVEDHRSTGTGPLAGIPLAHKDMFDRRGEAVGMGAHPSAERIATRTCDVLRRLDAAGQTQIARLRMSEFAMGPTGHNAHHPLPRNPTVEGAIPGGSSSGSGVAVASGLVPAALGSDTGGSIRIPAACNGVVGFKPGQGSVSNRDAMPLSWTQDCIGPLAASVACARLVLGLVMGRDISEDGRPLRVGLMMDGASPGMQTALTDLARAAEAAGHTLSEVPADLFAGLVEPANVIAMSEAATVHADRLRAAPDSYGPQVRGRLVQAAAIPAAAYLRARQIRALARERTAEYFTRADLMLMPTLVDVPPPAAAVDVGGGADVDRVVSGLTCFTRPASILGLPALSLPIAATSAGPLSVQIVGPHGAEGRVAAFAETLERIAAIRPVAATALS